MRKSLGVSNSSSSDGEHSSLSAEDSRDGTSSVSSEFDELTITKIVTDFQCFVLLASASLSVIFSLYVDVILAVALAKIFKVEEKLIGIYFTLASISYVIGAPLAAYLTKFVHRRYIVLLAFSLMTI